MVSSPINALSYAGLTTTSHMRLLFFEQPGNVFYIDFVPHHSDPGYVYIIPPHHSLFLHDNYSDICTFIDAMENTFTATQQRCLYRIKYVPQKSLAITQSCRDKNDVVNICLPGTADGIPAAANDDLSHLGMAQSFLGLLAEKRISQRLSVPNDFAAALNIHERTLRRVCKKMFGITTIDVLRYHLSITAMLLLADRGNTISDIAEMLEFSEPANFCRYMKTATGFSPTEIRLRLTNEGMMR